MLEDKKIIANKIASILETEIKEEELTNYIEIPKEEKMGDYAFPCFRLAKELKKSPVAIAEELKQKLDDIVEGDNYIREVQVVNGYLNFFLDAKQKVKEILKEIDVKKEKYGSSKIGEGRNIVIDYSSPNIAKPFHIGHLRSTVIGAALYNIYGFLGYHTIGVNHLGDYGTQFGKIIEGYKMWEKEYDIENNAIEDLTKIYVRINSLCKEDENILENCRNNFKKLEEGDAYCTELWNRFRTLTLKECQKVYDILGSKFDSWNGEAFYIDKMPEVIEILEKTGKLVESEGAKIIELGEDTAPCIIGKTNGSTTYATRDLAAVLYRARTYDFEKVLYVTSYEQVLHFKQIFEVAKLLGIEEKYTQGLIHVPFGMVRLKSGKMSTREGNIIKLEDLLAEAVSRAKKVIEEKNNSLEDKEEVAKKIGIGAVIFNDLSNNRIKDEVFDWDAMLNFQGETGPYVQYLYVRTKSVLEKAGYLPKIEEVDSKFITDSDSMRVIKTISHFQDTLVQVTEKNEPSILSRYLIELAGAYSTFYNNNKILGEAKEIMDARLYLTYATGNVLKIGMKLLGIEMPERM